MATKQRSRKMPLVLSLILVTVSLGQDPPNDAQSIAVPVDEVVKSLTLEFDVGPGGESLDEPLALDLGLGFPFWLHRLGRVDNFNAPFGAVSQTGQESHEIPAGQKAKFEFSAVAEPGLDTLHATPQMLSGLRLSDISRVGFCSKADHGWVLNGFKLLINDKLIASGNDLNANGRGLQDAAREQLAELNAQISPLQSEINELSGLAATGLANESDRAREQQISTELAPKLVERSRLERQLRGAAPFWTDDQFRAKLRAGNPVKNLKVTLVTAPHTGADSRNFVYFSVGGHKYLLGSPLSPLSAEYGPQEFDLDLVAAPLVAGDLRGFALGMQAVPEAISEVPDRWHPQRLRVEVDARIVYDSEDNTIDRMSLSAIRLVPPVTMSDSKFVARAPLAREVSEWSVGSGVGLDLIHGGPAELPAETDPAYPQAEVASSTLTSAEDLTDSTADTNDPFSSSNVTSNPPLLDDGAVAEIWYDPFAGPFPGETGYGPTWEPRLGQRLRNWLRSVLGLSGGGNSYGWYSGWGPGNGLGYDPGWGPGYYQSYGPGYGPGWTNNWLGLLLANLAGQQQVLPNWVLPQPVGVPPQLVGVELNIAHDSIDWNVTGDATQVDHFAIELVRLRPELDVPWSGAISETLDVPASQRTVSVSSLTVIPSSETADVNARSYAVARVRMIPTDAAIGVQQSLSPAMPLRAMSPTRSLHIGYQFGYIPPGGPATMRDVSLGGESVLPGPSVWVAGEVASHTGLVFAGVSPLQHHIVARAALDGDRIQVRLNSDTLPAGNYRIIAFVGFDGLAQKPAEVDVTCNATVQSVANPALHIAYPTTVHVACPAFPMSPMVPLLTDFNTADVGPGEMTVDLRYEFNQHHVDTEHPPMLVGLRLLGM